MEQAYLCPDTKDLQIKIQRRIMNTNIKGKTKDNFGKPKVPDIIAWILIILPGQGAETLHLSWKSNGGGFNLS